MHADSCLSHVDQTARTHCGVGFRSVLWLISICSVLMCFLCFLQGIFDTLKECAAISKSAGGIGLSIHNIRATVHIISVHF